MNILKLDPIFYPKDLKLLVFKQTKDSCNCMSLQLQLQLFYFTISSFHAIFHILLYFSVLWGECLRIVFQNCYVLECYSAQKFKRAIKIYNTRNTVRKKEYILHTFRLIISFSFIWTAHTIGSGLYKTEKDLVYFLLSI